ncbi:putative O-methyltransferase YrrM [Mycolicibacterium sp. BK556]|uniref:O-methyltransferase n=1 Tax=Mycobacteriaceae TaxID=1762 RepID=UPI00105F77DF|nr:MULTISPECIES: class I SAM-dependent methyltransferase [Mycobacteriaceae]MBB3603542.1 putative O-methyltransferase YrrM [Mycolicibacterium sp. BK556]MBB3633737.1 putative O-methyltransferase YrrM [Mycolicibacterium sp. BK607]TDO11850.1 putative O-methyltransferase YrrM [Mycobacterium sp. BK086]
MTNSLTTPAVSVVLQRLLSSEQAGDEAAVAAVLDAPHSPWDLDAGQRADVFKDVYMSVSGAGGQLLYLLARATGARNVVEYGTSFGVSTIHLASAVRDNGGGTVITTEMQRGKADAALGNFADAGVADLIELRFGDARETLAELPSVPDLVLLDGWPDLALDVLRVLEPNLRAGTLVLIDDVTADFGRDVHGALLAYLGDEANGYATMTVPIGDGIQIAVRL